MHPSLRNTDINANRDINFRMKNLEYQKYFTDKHKDAVECIRSEDCMMSVTLVFVSICLVVLAVAILWRLFSFRRNISKTGNGLEGEKRNRRDKEEPVKNNLMIWRPKDANPQQSANKRSSSQKNQRHSREHDGEWRGNHSYGLLRDQSTVQQRGGGMMRHIDGNHAAWAYSEQVHLDGPSLVRHRWTGTLQSPYSIYYPDRDDYRGSRVRAISDSDGSASINDGASENSFDKRLLYSANGRRASPRQTRKRDGFADEKMTGNYGGGNVAYIAGGMASQRSPRLPASTSESPLRNRGTVWVEGSRPYHPSKQTANYFLAPTPTQRSNTVANSFSALSSSSSRLTSNFDALLLDDSPFPITPDPLPSTVAKRLLTSGPAVVHYRKTQRSTG
jgi:hypothetical protein